MKKTATLLFLILCIAKSKAQYWQQKADFFIDVQLNESERTLDGFERITYTNNSPDTLRFIWFHLWPNAYKNDKTAFSEQLLQNGSTAFYFSNKEQRGYINQLDFKIDGITARTEDHPQHIDIIKLVLPKALSPGQQTTITTPFHVKLPFNFSRGGYDKNSFQVTQWYPKPAVYDAKGWHPMPYLDQGEFYSEFGNYEVHITLPKEFVVAATGLLQNDEEKAWWKERANYRLPAANKMRIGNAGNRFTAPGLAAPKETKTLTFRQNNVHDFAWFADKNFKVNRDTCLLSSGEIIQVQSYYTPVQEKLWQNSLQYAKDAARFYSTEVGEYPYGVVSVVLGPQSFGGGMEYPTITIISPATSAQELDATIAHEIGHNWFYGILASNERDYPWMDEGVNTFYERKYVEQKYGPQPQMEEIIFQTIAKRKKDQPIETTSENFSALNYGLVGYHKTAEWLKGLEKKAGADAFRRMMQKYFQRWQFKHPQPEDFKAVQQEVLNSDEWAALDQKGLFPQNELKGFQVVTPFRKNAVKNYLAQPVKNTLITSPAIGGNAYDGFMIGGLLTNYKLPPNKFTFLFAPMYATGSKQLTGLAKLNYTVTSNGFIRKTDLFVNAAHFSINDFKDTAGNRLTMQVAKLVPGFRLTFKEKDARSTTSRYVQWKTFFFNEESLRISPDTIFTGRDTALIQRYATPSKNRYLNQLQFVWENSRALYPFNLTLNVEQAKDFVRPAFTANYFFNYPKEGGLQLRFFAGTFMYLADKTSAKQFANDRYHLNMSGPNGYEDYTYSDYFIGRNKFEGLSSQQMMMRDGGFKVRTELLADKVGKTDEWLMALNLSTSVPQKINPLSALPVKIPLRIFFDIGTQAGGWKGGSDEDRFLFDAGLHIPLLQESINIYMPLFYSPVFGDYYKSTDNSFFKKISFTINLYNKQLKALNRIAEF